MNTPKEYQPPGELNNFSISMTVKIECIKKMTLKLDAPDFLIHWGDDSFSYESVHEYDLEGIYTISIKGKGLTKLELRNCSLTSLDIVEAPDLSVLDCTHNPLPFLRLSKLINLRELNCYGSELEELDVRNWKNLERLNCTKNHIRELYVTDCTNLRVLICAENRLKSLNVQGCDNLEWMDCSNNSFNAEELHSLCQSLPSVTNPKGGHICLAGNEGMRTCEIKRFNDKYWNVDDFKLSRGN